jgi:chemotaxis protein methyltransferase CheR
MVPYLSRLCDTLTTSMIDDNRTIKIKMTGEGGTASTREAESLGLIATELVMNALKHAFSGERTEGVITVAYDVDGPNWKLSVADNGIGKPDGVFAQPKTGLGTGIVKALARQLDAFVETSATPEGTVVSIIHATFSTKAGRAAQKAPIPFVRSPAAVPYAEAPIAARKRDS